MAKSRPAATVLMPVYNGEKYLNAAINSVLAQSCPDYEFVIIDDGSTDGSYEILKSYGDKRIRLIHNERNVGLSTTLNTGISLATADYIVRMDQDDISLPTRLQKQIDFMDSHPDVGLCGSWIEYIGIPTYPWTSRVFKYPIASPEIKSKLFFHSMFAHPSVILRNSFLSRFGLKYDQDLLTAEDWALWQKCSFCFELANIPEVLLQYRVHPGSMTQAGKRLEHETVLRINRGSLQAIGMDFSPEEELFSLHSTVNCVPAHLIQFHSWLEKVQHANSINHIYPEPEFSAALSEEWFRVCSRSYCLGLEVWRLFRRLSLGRVAKIGARRRMRFFFDSLRGCAYKLLQVF